MICGKRRILSAFIVLLLALFLALPEFFPFASSWVGTEYKTNIEETVLEERSAITDDGETIGDKMRWSVVCWTQRAKLFIEQEVKEFRTALELAAEKELGSGEPYLAAYYKFFKERWNGTYPNRDFNQGIRFRLVYIDGDEIPELLVIEPYCHASGVEVYTFCDDKLIEVGEFGSAGRMRYVEKEGLICSDFFNMGAGFSTFFKLEKGRLETICTLYACDGNSLKDGEDVYEIDDVPVSKETYDARWNELRRDDYRGIGYDDGILVEDILDLKELLIREAEDLKSGRVWKG